MTSVLGWQERRRQRGEGKVGCVIWILILVIAGYLGYQVIPVKIKDMQLNDHMKDLPNDHPRGTSKEYVDSILHRAEELGLPVERKNIEVDKNMQRAQMTVEYTVEVNLVVTTVAWPFSHKMERDIFLF